MLIVLFPYIPDKPNKDKTSDNNNVYTHIMAIDGHLVLRHLDRLTRDFLLRNGRYILHPVKAGRVRRQCPTNVRMTLAGRVIHRRWIGHLARKHTRCESVRQLEAEIRTAQCAWSTIGIQAGYAGRRFRWRRLRSAIRQGGRIVPAVAIRVPVLGIFSGGHYECS